MTLISQAEYARQKGVTPYAINSMIKRGRITLVDGKIDPELADQELAASNPRRRRKVQPNAVKQATGRTPQAAKVISLPSNPDKPPVTYAQANTMREAYRAQLAKLDYEQRVGKLVAVDQVKREAFEAARQVREAFMVLPERISAILAGQDEPFIRERLKAEVTLILKTLAGSLA